MLHFVERVASCRIVSYCVVLCHVVLYLKQRSTAIKAISTRNTAKIQKHNTSMYKIHVRTKFY